MTAPNQDLPETPVEVAWYHWLWVWFAALVLRVWLGPESLNILKMSMS